MTKALEITTRQSEIIDAAGKILTTSGVSGLTIKNLAKEMQFSESAIYRHFESKEDIILAMLEFLAKNMDERLTNCLAVETESELKFKAIFKDQFKFFSKNPNYVVAVFSDGLLESSEKINATISKIMQVKMKHLKPVIAEGQKNGDFTNEIAIDDLVHIVMGTFRLQMYKWRVSNFQFDINRNGDKLLNSILTLIKSK